MTSLESLKEAVKKLKKAVEELERKKRIYEKAVRKYEDAKGKLVERILKTEAFKKCNELRRKIEFLVSNFPQYDNEAAKLINYFKPFNYKRKVIRLQPLEYLAIGKTIYIVPNPRIYMEPSVDEVFQILLEHADTIVPNVRKNIREELAEFCRLGSLAVPDLDNIYI